MDAVQEILSSIPFGQLARQVGTDPATAEQMARQLIPALIGGMSANADDAAGAQSLAAALNDHAGSTLLDGGVQIEQVDTEDGDKIVQNVFGAHTPQVTQRLGAQLAGGNNELVQKLMRYLAPIVLAYLAKKLTEGRGGAAGGAGRGSGSILGDLLDSFTGGAQSQARQQQRTPSLPDILLDMLGGGGAFGGGQAQAPAPTQQRGDFQRPAPQAPASGGDGRAPQQIPLDDPEPARPAQQSGGALGGGLLGEILGGLLGGGRRA
ncbi:MAG: DUF937 domain-containing protein [Propionibacteriaceae bacterium]|nr:DUF937 domain-containing protein [Propionibacteriaceae bacterium]